MRQIKTSKRDRQVAVQYIRGELTRTEVNKKLKVPIRSLSGLHKVARAMRDLYEEGSITVTARPID